MICFKDTPAGTCSNIVFMISCRDEQIWKEHEIRDLSAGSFSFEIRNILTGLTDSNPMNHVKKLQRFDSLGSTDPLQKYSAFSTNLNVSLVILW